MQQWSEKLPVETIFAANTALQREVDWQKHEHPYRKRRDRPSQPLIMAKRKTQAPTKPVTTIVRAILVLRRQRVILDADLAALYGVTTKRLNEQVKRNQDRFPEDFMFRLTAEEATVLRSQFATSKNPVGDGRGGARYQPLAFTEHGAIQAANVLNSHQAVDMGVHVVRAFVQLRGQLTSHDEAIAAILSAIRELMHPPLPKRRGIGFTADISDPK